VGADASADDTYRALFERSADAILIIEGETFVDCNQATVEMLRCRDKAQLLETHPSELSPPTQPDGRDSYEKANEMIAIAFERGSHRFEWDHLRADGEVFPVEVLLTAVHHGDRPLLHVVWRDITERKRLESELRHAQKMEAIGRLAGGIAHDFNNLLVTIVGNADLLHHEVAGEPCARGHVEQIQQAADRAAGLIRQLLAFSRKQDVTVRIVDINELIRNFEGLLRRLIGEDIELVTDLSPAPLHVLCDPSQLEQVVLNLASNARDAMPEGGVLSIRTRLVEVEATGSATVESEDERARVLITVSDTGLGMTPETRRRAFDPFFTTKEVGEGTGLGLASAHGIIEQAGGSISLESATERGTRVLVQLPLCHGAPAAPPTERSATEGSGGGETILLVEDEKAVAEVIVRILARRGYEVITTRGGREALETYLERSREIDLIVSDVIMPGMGGPQLVAALREAGHSPPVLFVSGYTDSELSTLQELGEGAELLNKPFHARDLVRQVRRMLDRLPAAERRG